MIILFKVNNMKLIEWIGAERARVESQRYLWVILVADDNGLSIGDDTVEFRSANDGDKKLRK